MGESAQERIFWTQTSLNTSEPSPLRFSIIIATKNRPVLLDCCLTALGLLDFPRSEFEVVVVDDGSEPPLDVVIERHATQLTLQSTRLSGLGPAHARNAGLHRAIGQYVVFTDDDCTADSNWLKAFDEAFNHTPAYALGGRIVDNPENGVFGATSQILVAFLYSDSCISRDGLQFFCSNNLAFPREALLRLGGFDTSFPLAAAEDRDLCARWLHHGRMKYVPTAIVYHRQVLNLKSLWVQHYRYGRGAYQFWLRRRGEGHPGNSIKSLGFYARMFFYPFTRVPLRRAMMMAPLLCLTQLATAVGYFGEKRNGISSS